ncbi:MAG TPA: glycoside hydrolase family 15 protein [Streptosporangiaceae bacterium]|nr:glycoside hydrolase family 15 protein [Streptosporangiaceae bacterium]
MSIPLPDQPSWGRSQFPPIGDYGFLSDCETTALVAPNGGIEWLCLPRMDSPSVFGAILDRDAGSFRINPAGVEVPAARRYIPGTMVLETSWWTPGGWLVVTDALLMGPWHHDHERSATHRRAPTDYDADHVLLRLIRCVNGQAQVRMYCNPVFDYGRHPAQWEYAGEGYHEALATAEGAERSLRLTTDLNVGFEGPLATARTLLKDGQTHFVALSWSEHAPPRTFEEADARLTWTAHHWQHWLDRGRFPDHPWRSFVQTQVQRALEHWREPDQGIWEVRSGPQHFTFSKVACWVAADAGARLAEGRGEKKLAAQWRTAAEQIRADVLARAVDERGVFTQRYGGKALDASVLLIPLFRFLPPDDERVRNTVLAIADELTEDELVLRYRVDETEDGLTGEEGTFTICSFWLVSALVQIGELARGRALCEKLLSYASPLQLYAEEIDPRTGRQLGNFPQAFTHLALITAVTAVIRAERAQPR